MAPLAGDIPPGEAVVLLFTIAGSVGALVGVWIGVGYVGATWTSGQGAAAGIATGATVGLAVVALTVLLIVRAAAKSGRLSAPPTDQELGPSTPGVIVISNPPPGPRPSWLSLAAMLCICGGVAVILGVWIANAVYWNDSYCYNPYVSTNRYWRGRRFVDYVGATITTICSAINNCDCEAVLWAAIGIGAGGTAVLAAASVLTALKVRGSRRLRGMSPGESVALMFILAGALAALGGSFIGVQYLDWDADVGLVVAVYVGPAVLLFVVAPTAVAATHREAGKTALGAQGRTPQASPWLGPALLLADVLVVADMAALIVVNRYAYSLGAVVGTVAGGVGAVCVVALLALLARNAAEKAVSHQEPKASFDSLSAASTPGGCSTTPPPGAPGSPAALVAAGAALLAAFPGTTDPRYGSCPPCPGYAPPPSCPQEGYASAPPGLTPWRAKEATGPLTPTPGAPPAGLAPAAWAAPVVALGPGRGAAGTAGSGQGAAVAEQAAGGEEVVGEEAELAKLRSISHSAQDGGPYGSFNLRSDPVLAYVATVLTKHRGLRSAQRAASSAKSSLASSELDFEELELQRLIGEGSYGKVYLAKWHETLVAVKVLLTADEVTAADGQGLFSPALAELRKEASLMAGLRHPNVISFMGICTLPPAIVTEYCARGSLYDVLRTAGANGRAARQLTWQRRLGMLLDAAKGMLYLHSCAPPIVHRDLKSPNLLVDFSWRVKVCDFNLSKIMESKLGSVQSTLMGDMNPRWLAPEVMQGEHASAASDVFAFGVVMWEVLTWEVPWQRANSYQLIGLVMNGGRLEIPTDDRLPGGAEFGGLLAYEALLERCWAQNPHDRPSFAEVILELRRLYDRTLDAKAPMASTPELPGTPPASTRALSAKPLQPSKSSADGGSSVAPNSETRVNAANP